MAQEEIPYHVAIIMDGNRRWAKKRGLKGVKGYDEGANTLKELCLHIIKQGTKVLSVFAFSTENFKRPAEEVDYLMRLFIKKFNEEFDFVKQEQIQVLFSGTLEHLQDDVKQAMIKIQEDTKDNKKGILNIALNYGGRKEIVDAAKRFATSVLNHEMSVDELTEENFGSFLYHDLPPVDLLIRTSGELRISNFMLWQVSYAEFYFSDVYFPDFTVLEYQKALASYQERNRKFGGN